MDKAVTALIAEINRKEGEDTVILGSQINTDLVPRVTTGSLSLDVALGGGWPANQWNEIIGNETHGKTTVVLKTLAANMARDPNWTCVWVAAEDFDKRWAATLGVDLSRVVLIPENGMETALNKVLRFMETKAIDCVVVDSWPMLSPEREAEHKDGMEGNTPGLAAILSGQFFRLNRRAMKRSMTQQERPVLGLIVNQWREKIGVMYGDPRTTPGGKAKNFAFYTRVEVVRDDWIKAGDDYVGQTIRALTVKNKSHPPRRTAYVDFYFDSHGEFRKGDYDAFKEIVNLGVLYEVIERRGAYYYYDGEQIAQGRVGLLDALRERDDLREKISAQVLQVTAHPQQSKRVEDAVEEQPVAKKTMKRRAKK